MINFDDVIEEETNEHNPNWPKVYDHPHRILVIGGSGSGKKCSLFNIINEEPDFDKDYLYAKDPYETKQQFFINKRESTELKPFNDSKTFMKYLKDMDDIIKYWKIQSK